ncbi:plasmid mobilization protein [Acidicapsa ligni]|uniref:plasmid mobilization protein n=1 Tax=Acidicapsa ligni TaxID=542300 RepID=UPI0021E0F905|nr:hypothetical protein [Acidicapsa ligni]
MRRTVAASDPPLENFSSLLERLAQRVNTLEDEGNLEDNFEGRLDGKLGTAGTRVSTPALRSSSGTRLKPIDPLPTSERQRKQEGISLSYEQALRAHSRYRPTSDSILPVNSTAAAGTMRSQHSQARNETQPVGKASPAPQPLQAGKRGVKKQTKTAKYKTGRRIAGSDPSPLAQPKGRADKWSTMASKTAAKTAIKTASKTAEPAEIVRAERELAVIRSADNRMQTQRTTAVSARLSLEESIRLRSRAAESGMSVPAYLRSCVLEADELRTQVKQALIAMRAQSLESAPRQLATPPVAQGNAGPGRLLFKFAAFFFGDRNLLRRSA